MIKSLILKILKNRLDKGEPFEEVLDSYLLKISSYKEEIIKELYDYMKYDEPHNPPVSIQDQAVTTTTSTTEPSINTLGNNATEEEEATQRDNTNIMGNEQEQIVKQDNVKQNKNNSHSRFIGLRLTAEEYSLIEALRKNNETLKCYSISNIIRRAIKEYCSEQLKGGNDNSLLPKQ